MRLTCPCCGATNSLEALLTDAAARQAIAAALALPGLGDRLVRYLGLFRPQGRGLTWDRVARLLEELNTALAAGQIERHGQVWPAPLDYWKLALDQILDARPTLTLPLKSHGYLYEILVGLSRKATEASAARQEADAERARARARAGDRHGSLQPAARLIPPAMMGGGKFPPFFPPFPPNAGRPGWGRPSPGCRPAFRRFSRPARQIDRKNRPPRGVSRRCR